MPYIFIDESGDLGFNFRKKGTSRYFIVAAIKVGENERRSLEKAVRKTFSSAQSKYHVKGTLHATEEREDTRRKLFNLLKTVKCEILYTVLDKTKLPKDRIKMVDIYRHMVEILIEKALRSDTDSKYPLVCVLSRREASRSKNTSLKHSLESIAQTSIQKVCIEIKKPAEEKGLQAADFVSWALFAKLNGDDSYSNLVENKITLVSNDFHKKQNRTNLSDHPMGGPVVRNYLLAK